MEAEIRILSTDGKLYKSELWDSSKTAKGIVVFDLERNHQFVIEVNSYDTYCVFSNDNEPVDLLYVAAYLYIGEYATSPPV